MVKLITFILNEKIYGLEKVVNMDYEAVINTVIDFINHNNREIKGTKLLIDTLIQLKENFSVEKLIDCIQVMYQNAEKNDYLKRNKLKPRPPIVQLDNIPHIYIAINMLVEMAFKDFRAKNQGVPVYVAFLARQFLIVSEEVVKKGVFTPGLHFSRYTYDYMQCSEVMKPYHDRLVIDAILWGGFYQNLSIQDAMRRHSIHSQVQPGIYSASTDQTLYFNPYNDEVLAYDNEVGGAPSALDNYGVSPTNFPIKLMAEGISQCHTVVVYDSKGGVWLLHVSPAALTGLPDNPHVWCKVKPAYSDLRHLPKGKIDVVVVNSTSSGYQFNNEMFCKALPEGVNIESINIISKHEHLKADGHNYCVGFLPNINEIYIVSEDEAGSFAKIADVFPNLAVSAKANSNLQAGFFHRYSGVQRQSESCQICTIL